jgi:hypothetical protein
MCTFCENEQSMLSRERILPLSWGFGYDDCKISLSETETITEHLYIDRGFLRLVNIEDSQCIESGEKIKINYCPICGNKLDLI